MVLLRELTEKSRTGLENLDCPEFDVKPWVDGPPLSTRKVTIISSAGIHARSDKTFSGGEGGYRAIPGDTVPDQIVMSHISSNFDRTGFQQDLNLVLPIDRMRELAEDGFIGQVAETHYSFMGATDPRDMEKDARDLAGKLKADGVHSAILLPV